MHTSNATPPVRQIDASTHTEGATHGPGLVGALWMVLHQPGVGVALFAWCVMLFAKVGRGTLALWDPTRHLVTVGPYRISRTPMIVGVTSDRRRRRPARS